MLFNSYEFILIFLPITLCLYYKLADIFSHNAAKYFLIIASLVFYSYWDIANLQVLLISITVNYIIGHYIQKTGSKYILGIGIVFNILYLMYFKYTDFIIENSNILLGTSLAKHNILLPLGISFFTFTQTAYLVDIYRGEAREYTKSDFLLFVTIFPHLIAGPILYHKDIIPQFSVRENYQIQYKNLVYGLTWFIVGLFKKVCIADKLAEYVSLVYGNTADLSMSDAWIGSFAYTLQLYFDFSGYSEMAIGLGLMLNIKLPLNFHSPYKACSIIDFWRRWHITLSNFLKNYLYIPLGGNRTGHHLRNIMITMFLGGLWHGAGWTFIFWGILHGIFICINHCWRRLSVALPEWLSWLLTFNAVNVAWIFFRAEHFSDALNVLQAMFLYDGKSHLFALKDILSVVTITAAVLIFPSVKQLTEKYFKTDCKWFMLLILLFLVSFFNMYKNSEFLYFQF